MSVPVPSCPWLLLQQRTMHSVMLIYMRRDNTSLLQRARRQQHLQIQGEQAWGIPLELMMESPMKGSGWQMTDSPISLKLTTPTACAKHQDRLPSVAECRCVQCCPSAFSSGQTLECMVLGTWQALTWRALFVLAVLQREG